MAPIQLQDMMGPKDVAPKATRKKSRRNQGTPPPRTPGHKEHRNSPEPAIRVSKRSVSFSLPVPRKESLSDSELTKVLGLEDSYAGAKFSEAPSPNFLPMPPSTWLMRENGLEPLVEKEHRSSAKNVPCERITDELKILLKVAS